MIPLSSTVLPWRKLTDWSTQHMRSCSKEREIETCLGLLNVFPQLGQTAHRGRERGRESRRERGRERERERKRERERREGEREGERTEKVMKVNIYSCFYYTVRTGKGNEHKNKYSAFLFEKRK